MGGGCTEGHLRGGARRRQGRRRGGAEARVDRLRVRGGGGLQQRQPVRPDPHPTRGGGRGGGGSGGGRGLRCGGGGKAGGARPRGCGSGGRVPHIAARWTQTEAVLITLRPTPNQTGAPWSRVLGGVAQGAKPSQPFSKPFREPNGWTCGWELLWMVAVCGVCVVRRQERRLSWACTFDSTAGSSTAASQSTSSRKSERRGQ